MRLRFERLRFLIIDPNAAQRLSLRIVLEAFGSTEIFESANGQSALEAVQTHSPDIVLTDWDLPLFNGLDLTRRIRSLSEGLKPYTPVVILAERANRRRVLAARDAGAHEFLAKPVDPKALYERILSIIAAPRPFIRTSTFFGPDRRRLQQEDYAGPERRFREVREPLRRDSKLGLLLGKEEKEAVYVTTYSDHEVIELADTLRQKALDGEGDWRPWRDQALQRIDSAREKHRGEAERMMRVIVNLLQETRAEAELFAGDRQPLAAFRSAALDLVEEARLLGFPLASRIAKTLGRLLAEPNHMLLAGRCVDALKVMAREGLASQEGQIAQTLTSEIERLAGEATKGTNKRESFLRPQA